MAWAFGDSFDLYANTGQMQDALGYWDNLPPVLSFNPGRFGGQSLNTYNTNNLLMLTKSSGVNDAVHHLVMAISNPIAITGTSLACAWTFSDGATAQCSIVFRSDGAFVLTSGGPAGAVLATYTGAVTATNTWYAFEFEIQIHPTNGLFNVRKNGNSVNDFSSSGLNTRVSANSYANKLTIQTASGGSGHQMSIDDIFWKSDAASVPWLGDIRAFVRAPLADASVQFTRAPSPISHVWGGNVTSNNMPANWAAYRSYVPPYSGQITSISYFMQTLPVTPVHMKMCIYDATRATILATFPEVTNPGQGWNSVTLATALPITKGTQYWIGTNQDATLPWAVFGGNTGLSNSSTPYATFPLPSPPSLTANLNAGFTGNVLIIPRPTPTSSARRPKTGSEPTSTTPAPTTPTSTPSRR